jgi:predicted amidophosphoribosyltransferase
MSVWFRRAAPLYIMQTRSRESVPPVVALTRQCRILSRAALEFFYPPACAICHLPLVGGETFLSDRLCADCLGKLAPQVTNRCRRCSAPVGPYLDTQPDCIHCHDERFAFGRVVSIGAYHDVLRQACIAAKAGSDTLAVAFAEVIWSQHVDVLRAARIDAVIPVPHHWTERLVRRVLPPETMARVLARRIGAAFEPHLLAKIRRTPAQADLTPTQRRANLRRAFACRGVNLRSASVLLVDDVLTTGTTAHRASVELRRAGAGPVLVAVAARGIGQRP